MMHAYHIISRVHHIVSRVYLCGMCLLITHTDCLSRISTVYHAYRLLITHIDCFAASPRFAPLFDLKTTKRCIHILLSL